MQEAMTEPLVDSASGNLEEGGEAGKNEDVVFNRREMLYLSVSSFYSTVFGLGYLSTITISCV